MTEEGDQEHSMRVWEAGMARSAHVFGFHLAAVIGFASLTIKSIILANASAGAILAFFATMWGKPQAAKMAEPVLHSVSILAGGVFAAIICAALSYIAQYSYAMSERKSGSSQGIDYWSITATVCHILALLAAAAGILSFYLGVTEALAALKLANGGTVK
ncbi:MAG: hypothetical protein O2912_05320 [Proteobacteria bacterium]|nr:hypothetical protein [Pseudomonadota bacterium]